MEIRTSPLLSSTEPESELDTPPRSDPTTTKGEEIFTNHELRAGIEQCFDNDESVTPGFPEGQSGDFPDSEDESEDVVRELLAMVCKTSLPSSDVQHYPTVKRLFPRRLRLKWGLRWRVCGVNLLWRTIRGFF